MTKTPLPLASALLLAACGQPAAVASVAPSQLAPPEAFECVMKTFPTLGYQRTMYDQDELRTSARKENKKIKFSNVQFRKTWDRMDVDVEAGMTGTDLEIVIVTEAEYFNQRGKTLEQVSPSEDVQQAARELRSRCGGSAPSNTDSVPSVSQ